MSSEMSAKIKRLRRENGLTLEQVADAVGVGKSTVRKWETGMIESLRCDKLPALADVLHTTPAYLVCLDPEPTDLADSVPSLDVHALADIIVQYRTDHDLSQRQFSAYCGISNGYIAMIERGMNPKTGKPVVPTIPSLIKIASGMGMALSDLLHAVGFTMEDSVDSFATSGGSSGVGTRIHDLRVGLGLSADELADMIGKNRATVYRYEDDSVEIPSSVIGPLASALHVSPAYLMGWEKNSQTVGERIRDARTNMGITQEELGNLCDTTKQTIYKYETGIVTNIPLERLKAIANALHVPLSHLIGLDDCSILSSTAQKIAVAYDQATWREKSIIDFILSPYIPPEDVWSNSATTSTSDDS